MYATIEFDLLELEESYHLRISLAALQQITFYYSFQPVDDGCCAMIYVGGLCSLLYLEPLLHDAMNQSFFHLQKSPDGNLDGV